MPVRQQQNKDDARIGPITIFALIAVVCLAVLAVLALTTANASYNMTQRQATAISELYLDETAAQNFMAELDGALAEVRQAGGTNLAALAAASRALEGATETAESAAGGRVSATATLESDAVNAQFTCQNGRTLTVVATVQADATLRIDQWKISATQTESTQQTDHLWAGE